MNPHVRYAPKRTNGSFKKTRKGANPLTSYLWQADCAKRLRGVRFANVSAPCGAGKTVALTLLAAQELHDTNLKQKQIIIAPQRVIGEAFTDASPIIVDSVTYAWNPQINNFVNFQNKSVLRALRNWLLSTADFLLRTATDKHSLNETVAITSHQALAIVWGRLSKSERKQALKNLTITVDEAHHISGVFDENGTTELTKEEKEESNHLGEVIQAAVHAGKSTHVRLATATFYRGDAQPILDKTVAAEFQKGTFILSWLEHWDNLGLDSFSIDYRFYDKEPIADTLKQIADDPKHVFMVFLPPSNIAWCKDNLSRRKALFSGLRKQFGDDAVLDLVTQGTSQDNNVKRLRADVKNIKAGNKPTFKAIVSVGIGLEGMDYVPVDRLINLGVQNSIVRAVQVMGRPMRKYEGKRKVTITNYVPALCKPSNGASIPDALADRTNAILVCLAWDDITHPIIVHLIGLSVKLKGKRKGVALTEALGSQYANVLENVLVAVEKLKDKTHIKAAIAKVLEKAGFEPDAALIEGLEVAARRAQLKAHDNPRAQLLSNLFDVSMLRKNGYNILKQYTLDKQTIFFGDCSKVELKQAKDAITQYMDGLGEFDVFKREYLKYHKTAA